MTYLSSYSLVCHNSFMTLSWLFHDSFVTLSWLFCDSFVTLLWLFCDSFMTLLWLFHVLLNCFFNENHLNDYWQRKFEIWNWFFIFLWKILWTDYFELQRISKFICYWLVSFIFSGIALVFRDWSASQPSLRASWPSWVVS